jgi:hypothetical protein
VDHTRNKMICQVCPDKRKANLAIDDAKRITNGLKRLISSGRITSRKTTPIMFHEQIRCNYTANTCSNYRILIHELKAAEQELKRIFDQICLYIVSLLESNDEDTANRMVYHANQLLRGHYPHAVRYLSRGVFR